MAAREATTTSVVVEAESTTEEEEEEEEEEATKTTLQEVATDHNSNLNHSSNSTRTEKRGSAITATVAVILRATVNRGSVI